MPFIIPSRPKAILSVQNLSSPAIFIHSSACNWHIGIDIHNRNMLDFPVSSTTVPTIHTPNIFKGELLAIDVALAQLTHSSSPDLPWIHQSVTL